MIYTNRRVFALLIGLLVTVFATCNLVGQATATGTIQGTVTDKSNAVVAASTGRRDFQSKRRHAYGNNQ